MIIHEADGTVYDLPLIERTMYAYRNIANAVDRVDNNEPLVNAAVIEQAGLRVEPFWEMPGDLEGETYRDYMTKHNGFVMSVRQEALYRLLRAQGQLPAGWQLVLKAGYRPPEIQRATLQRFIEKSQHDHPNWKYERHLAHARTFVSDPAIVCPPHTTGGAVDVAVYDNNTQTYIDMGCELNTDNELAYLHATAVSPQQRHNRMQLLQAMLDAGFAPYPYEWWHYQFGETYWAAFYGHDTTHYDIVR